MKLLLLIHVVLCAKDINVRLAELPCAYVALEKHVELSKGSALWLREAEVSPGKGQKAEAGPEESRLALPVPRCGVKHVGNDYSIRNAKHIV